MIFVVFGTTGELIKLAPVLLRLDERGNDYLLATTGQQVQQIPSFLDQFGLRQPDVWLGRGAGGRDLRTNRDIPSWLTHVSRSFAASRRTLRTTLANGTGRPLTLVHGDMATELPDGPFAVVLVAFNTFFSLTSAEAQQRCLAHVADRLAPRGRFVLEAFVPDEGRIDAGSRIEVRSVTRDRDVLTVSRHDAELQRAEGQFVELSESGGVRLRPWSLRYAGPAELDRMAAAPLPSTNLSISVLLAGVGGAAFAHWACEGCGSGRVRAARALRGHERPWSRPAPRLRACRGEASTPRAADAGSKRELRGRSFRARTQVRRTARLRSNPT